jgi:hypothetical protein
MMKRLNNYERDLHVHDGKRIKIDGNSDFNFEGIIKKTKALIGEHTENEKLLNTLEKNSKDLMKRIENMKGEVKTNMKIDQLRNIEKQLIQLVKQIDEEIQDQLLYIVEKEKEIVDNTETMTKRGSSVIQVFDFLSNKLRTAEDKIVELEAKIKDLDSKNRQPTTTTQPPSPTSPPTPKAIIPDPPPQQQTAIGEANEMQDPNKQQSPKKQVETILPTAQLQQQTREANKIQDPNPKKREEGKQSPPIVPPSTPSTDKPTTDKLSPKPSSSATNQQPPSLPPPKGIPSQSILKSKPTDSLRIEHDRDLSTPMLSPIIYLKTNEGKKETFYRSDVLKNIWITCPSIANCDEFQTEEIEEIHRLTEKFDGKQSKDSNYCVNPLYFDIQSGRPTFIIDKYSRAIVTLFSGNTTTNDNNVSKIGLCLMFNNIEIDPFKFLYSKQTDESKANNDIFENKTEGVFDYYPSIIYLDRTFVGYNLQLYKYNENTKRFSKQTGYIHSTTKNRNVNPNRILVNEKNAFHTAAAQYLLDLPIKVIEHTKSADPQIIKVNEIDIFHIFQ